MVSIYLDESEVTVCLEHDPCPNDGRAAGPKCRRMYLNGVGAALFESPDDRGELASHLGLLKSRIAARSGVATSRPMRRFVRDGWHATDDPPEFADPFIQELDLDGVFKGHVRYSLTPDKLANHRREQSRLFLAD